MGLFAELKNAKSVILGLFFGALILRLLFLSLHERPNVSDERDFDRLAKSIAFDGQYAIDGVPTAYRPVGYPLFLAGVHSLFQNGPFVARVIQSVLDSCTSVLLFLLYLSDERRKKIWAGVLWAVFPAAIVYCSFLLAETLFTFLIVLFSFLLAKGNPRSTALQLAIGFVIGGMALVKPWAALLVFVFVVLAKTLNFPRRAYAITAAAFLVTIAPWLYRNTTTLGAFTLSTNTGMNLLVGNHPRATGAYSSQFPLDSVMLNGSEVESGHAAMRTAVRHMVNDPGGFLIRGMKKVALLFSSEGELLVLTFSGQPSEPSDRYSAKYASIPFILILLFNTPSLAMLLLWGISVPLARKTHAWRITITLSVVVLIIHFVFFGGSRFRFPLMPGAALMSVAMLTGWKEMWTQSDSRTRGLAILLAGLILAVWIIEGAIIVFT